MDTKNIIAGWPATSREMAHNIIDKYGQPDEATPSMLIWYDNSPWKRTIVYRDGVKHNFPIAHLDIIEQVVNHEIPMECACEVAAFNGSVILYPTRGEISSCADSEAANILALNLAHDIIQDKKNFEQARFYYTRNIIEYQRGKSTPYMERLLFTPEKRTADPDESAISEKELAKATL
jgi:hypothetical protein